MTYRSLLVFLDSGPRCIARTHTAIGLAKGLGCHLVGVVPTGLIEVPISPGAATAISDYSALAWDALRAQAERVADRFREDCHVAGLKSHEAVIDEADKAQSVVRHAHCSDLTVVSQADPAALDFRAAQDLVEQVVLNSARPTLIIPHAGHTGSISSNVMVAWDDSREAARAVSDALPLLRLARQVEVVSWNERGAVGHKTLRPRLDALRQWLMWQGVSAELRNETPAVDIASAMRSRATELGADLIVMGAYGHSRWAERVMGGATRGLLDGLTVPVLMSH
jgi:nucleotide-binding universal stress UspA family protein